MSFGKDLFEQSVMSLFAVVGVVAGGDEGVEIFTGSDGKERFPHAPCTVLFVAAHMYVGKDCERKKRIGPQGF